MYDSMHTRVASSNPLNSSQLLMHKSEGLLRLKLVSYLSTTSQFIFRCYYLLSLIGLSSIRKFIFLPSLHLPSALLTTYCLPPYLQEMPHVPFSAYHFLIIILHLHYYYAMMIKSEVNNFGFYFFFNLLANLYCELTKFFASAPRLVILCPPLRTPDQLPFHKYSFRNILRNADIFLFNINIERQGFNEGIQVTVHKPKRNYDRSWHGM